MAVFRRAASASVTPVTRQRLHHPAQGCHQRRVGAGGKRQDQALHRTEAPLAVAEAEGEDAVPSSPPILGVARRVPPDLRQQDHGPDALEGAADRARRQAAASSHARRTRRQVLQLRRPSTAGDVTRASRSRADALQRALAGAAGRDAAARMTQPGGQTRRDAPCQDAARPRDVEALWSGCKHRRTCGAGAGQRNACMSGAWGAHWLRRLDSNQRPTD